MDEREVEAALQRAKAAIVAYLDARKEMEDARAELARIVGHGRMVALVGEIDAIRPDLN